MPDTTSTVQIVVKATTDTAVAAVKKFDAAMDAAGKTAAGFGKGMSAAWGTATEAMDVAAKGVQKFKQAMDLALDAGAMRQTELAFSKLNASVEQFQKAADGSVSRMKLMEIANKNMRGDFALTRNEMTLVFQAADNLTDKGFGSMEENIRRVTDALHGKTKGLKDVGISIGETTDKSKQFQDVLGKIKGLAEDTAPEDKMGKSLDQFSVRVQDAADRLRMGLGSAIGHVLLMLDRLLSKLGVFEAISGNYGGDSLGSQAAQNELRRRGIENPADAYNKAPVTGTAIDFFAQLTGNRTRAQMGAEVEGLATGSGGYASELQKLTLRKGLAETEEARNAAVGAGIEQGIYDFNRGVLAVAEKAKKKRGGGGKAGGGVDLLGYMDKGFDVLRSGYAEQGERRAAIGDVAGAFGDAFSGIGGAFTSVGFETGAFVRGAGLDEEEEEKLSPEDKFRRSMDKMREAGSGWAMLYDTAQASLGAFVSAAIDGHGKALQAFRVAVAGQMKGAALQNAARAIESVGMGFYTGSPSYFVAAAKFAAAAAAYGAGAALLGGGGGSGGGNSTGGAPAYGGGGGGYMTTGGVGGPSNITINLSVPPGADQASIGETVMQALEQAQRATRTGTIVKAN